MDFNKISENEFQESRLPKLFGDQNSSRCFAGIQSGLTGFKFGWHSDLIEPMITEIETGTYSIGIDQNFAVVKPDIERVILLLDLTYNFSNTIIRRKELFICTELEILKFKLGGDYHLLSSYLLPDIFEELIFQGDNINVKCLGNKVLSLS